MSSYKGSPENLTAISTFVCVGESRSLTAAAQKLQISVSGVSRALSRLEDRLRVRLVNRTSRSISLTDEGAAYFERCRQILAELEEAEAEITDVKTHPRGRLRIQVPRALGKRIVIPALPRFLENNLGVVVDVLLDARSLNLEEEGIDVALRYGIALDSPLVARKLCGVSYVTCAAPAYIEQFGEPDTPRDLIHHRCVNYLTPQDSRHRRWNFIMDGNNFSPSISSVLNVNDMAAVTEAAIRGAGIAYLPDFMVADHLETGELKLLLPSHIFEGAPVYMVYPKRRYTPPRSRVFCEFLTALLPASPKWREVIAHHARKSGQKSIKIAAAALPGDSVRPSMRTNG